jgi:hypothetical protein
MVRLAKPLKGEAGKISVDGRGVERSVKLPAGNDEVTIGGVKLGRGPLDLVVEIETKDEAHGPYQVVIRPSS